MESTSYDKHKIVKHALSQMQGACDLILQWNKDVTGVNDYLCSPSGMQIMAATCMLIESIGESVKKVDKLMPDFLSNNQPSIPWRQIAGMRNHIAHGYFDIDAEVVFDVVKHNMDSLYRALVTLSDLL